MNYHIGSLQNTQIFQNIVKKSKELKKILPISFEQIKIAIKIPAAHAAKTEHILHKYKLQKEEWQANGDLVAVVEMPAGLRQDFLNDLNGVCHGDVETKILEK